MDWLTDNRHWLLFAAALLSALGAAGVAVVGFVATLSTLATGGPILGLVAGWVLGTALLAGLALVFGVKLAATLASRASLPTNRRLAAGLHRVERAVPPLSRLGLGDRFEPSVEERREALTRRYVDGDLTEAELERELRALLEDADDEVADREAVAEAAADDERAVEVERG